MGVCRILNVYLLSLIEDLSSGKEAMIQSGPCSKAYPINLKSMPKILQINVTANWGSTGRIAEQINDAARQKGWDCYLAYSRMANPSASKLIKIGTKIDVLWAVLETRLFDKAGLSMRYATKRLIKQIDKIKPNVIHLHNIHGYVLNYKLLFEYLNKTNIKIVWTFHDFWAITGHCPHFVSVNCNKWVSLCNNCPLTREYPSSKTDYSSRNFSLKKVLFLGNKNLHIVAVSKWVENFVAMSFLRYHDHRTITNGVDLSIFKPLDSFSHPLISDGKFVIIGVATQWAVDKGLEDYIEMSKMLEDDELIVLVGVSDEVIAKLPHNIIGIKRTASQNELAALYTRADVVTVLSSAETFGLTVVEGYACGTPAVVYGNTAPPSLITEETGFVANDKDYKEVYFKIQQIKQNGKSHYSDACIKLANVKYDKNKCFAEYINLYEELVKDSGK